MVVMNGRFHWRAHEDPNDVFHDMIATFDVSNEVFSRIELPNLFGLNYEEVDSDDADEEVLHGRKLGWQLVVLKEDYLGVIIYPNTCKGRQFDMWLLDENGVEKSWAKCFSFGHNMNVHRPLGCKSNGEILMFKVNGQLVVYDSVTDALKMVPVHGIPFCEEVFYYVGSLLPIEGGKAVNEANFEAVEPDPFFVKKFDMGLW